MSYFEAFTGTFLQTHSHLTSGWVLLLHYITLVIDQNSAFCIPNTIAQLVRNWEKSAYTKLFCFTILFYNDYPDFSAAHCVSFK